MLVSVSRTNLNFFEVPTHEIEDENLSIKNVLIKMEFEEEDFDEGKFE